MYIFQNFNGTGHRLTVQYDQYPTFLADNSCKQEKRTGDHSLTRQHSFQYSTQCSIQSSMCSVLLRAITDAMLAPIIAPTVSMPWSQLPVCHRVYAWAMHQVAPPKFQRISSLSFSPLDQPSQFKQEIVRYKSFQRRMYVLSHVTPTKHLSLLRCRPSSNKRFLWIPKTAIICEISVTRIRYKILSPSAFTSTSHSCNLGRRLLTSLAFQWLAAFDKSISESRGG
jgi:hypothetical protein